MRQNSERLWQDFKNSLNENIANTPYSKLESAWKTDATWTHFYKGELFWGISKGLNLLYDEIENLRIDAVFYEDKETHGYKVPIVCIESENNAEDIERSELPKLCLVNSPLKIIFTKLPQWDEITKKERTEDEWDYVINAFKNANQLVGYIGIIIVVKEDDKFRFHSFAYTDKGEITLEETLVKKLDLI